MADARNPHGSFIWYELLTEDPDSAAAFYGDVIGWTASGAGQPGVDYRFFAAGDGTVAGHMKVPEGMDPLWLGYIGVDNVDETVSGIEQAGGKVHMPAMDMDGVGRIAMVADPQGVPFYVMRGAVEAESRSFDPKAAGHCSWNELSTPDPAAALDFYTGLFGWTKGEAMPMGELGEYRFLHQGEGMIGAAMPTPPGLRSAWNFAFGVRDIDEAASRIRAGGGTVHHGPAEVPGGDRVVMASDPQGVRFMAVGPRG